MKPVNIGGHSAYQERVLTQLRKYYPDAASSLSPSTWQIPDKFWNLDLSKIDVLTVEFKITSYTRSASFFIIYYFSCPFWIIFTFQGSSDQ